MTGKLILIIGPSGSGKSTLIDHLRVTYPDIVFPISCTTRVIRPGERDGKNHYFLTREKFEVKIKNDEFLEWASYGGNLYGTLKAEVFGPLEEGKMLVREVEVQGARILLDKVPQDNLVIIFINAGSWEVLSDRIQKRAPMSSDEFELRKQRYDDEVSFKSNTQYIIENTSNIEYSIKQLDSVIDGIKKELNNES